jgi:hypothetical protein
MNLQRGQGAVGHLLKIFVNNKVADYNETIFEAVTNTSKKELTFKRLT